MLTPRANDPNRANELKRREYQPLTFGKRTELPNAIDLSQAFKSRQEEDRKEIHKPTIGDKYDVNATR